MTSPLRLSLRITGASVALVVLFAVFMLYTRPDFLVQMANQIWACF
ncbi:hypothetical protein [Rhodoferax saidenbachensis]|nr:hypothetical protein [Rhodoferax saidenbachensis]